MARKPMLGMLQQAVLAWWNDQAPSKGAALAYYSLFSIAPMLFIVIAVAGLVYGPDAVRGAVFGQVADLMGANGAEAVREMLAHVSEPRTGGWATALSTALLVFGATTVFAQLQAALDEIWDAPAEPAVAGTRDALWAFVKGRLLSFGLVLALAFLIIVSLVLSAALSALGKWWGPAFGEWETVAQGVNLAVATACWCSCSRRSTNSCRARASSGATSGSVQPSPWRSSASASSRSDCTWARATSARASALSAPW